jgi:hypothetical protein
LLIIGIFALASAAGYVSLYERYSATSYRYDSRRLGNIVLYGYRVFAMYNGVEIILEVFLQTGIIVALLFATRESQAVISTA